MKNWVKNVIDVSKPGSVHTTERLIIYTPKPDLDISLHSLSFIDKRVFSSGWYGIELIIKSKNHATLNKNLLSVCGCGYSTVEPYEAFIEISNPKWDPEGNQKNLQKIESTLKYLKTQEPSIPELRDVHLDMLAECDIIDKRIPLVEELLKKQNYDEALKNLIALQKWGIKMQNSGDMKAIWDYCQMVDKHLFNGEPLPEGYPVGSMDATTLCNWYQEIDEKNPCYKEANTRLYQLYLNQNVGKFEKEDKEILFRFALRSGDQQLIDASFNSLCGFVNHFKNVKGDEETLLSNTRCIATLSLEKKQLTEELARLKSSSSQGYTGPRFNFG